MSPAKKLIKQALYFIHRNPYHRQLFERTIKNRTKLPFTDIAELTKHINLYSPFTYELHQPNDYYGHAAILKKFLDIDHEYPFKFVIEHGVYLDDQVATIDLSDDFTNIITCSSYRKPILEKYQKKVYPIGPYFHYAPNLLTENELLREKKRLGDTLLFFPTHSAPGIEAKFNVTQLCEQVNKLKKQFRTIRICLYWQDVLSGAAKVYQSFGFECVTAGHVLDPNFMPRLKSIIETSTITASNDIGACIGYCIMMSKPHFILKQKLDFKGTKYQVGLVDEYHQSKTYKQILSTFAKYNEKITKVQIKIVDFFWGANDIKTKRELLKIVEETEKNYSTQYISKKYSL